MSKLSCCGVEFKYEARGLKKRCLWLKLNGRGWVVSVENGRIRRKWNGKKIVGGCLRMDDCVSLDLGLMR